MTNNDFENEIEVMNVDILSKRFYRLLVSLFQDFCEIQFSRIWGDEWGKKIYDLAQYILNDENLKGKNGDLYGFINNADKFGEAGKDCIDITVASSLIVFNCSFIAAVPRFEFTATINNNIKGTAYDLPDINQKLEKIINGIQANSVEVRKFQTVNKDRGNTSVFIDHVQKLRNYKNSLISHFTEINDIFAEHNLVNNAIQDTLNFLRLLNNKWEYEEKSSFIEKYEKELNILKILSKNSTLSEETRAVVVKIKNINEIAYDQNLIQDNQLEPTMDQNDVSNLKKNSDQQEAKQQTEGLTETNDENDYHENQQGNQTNESLSKTTENQLECSKENQQNNDPKSCHENTVPKKQSNKTNKQTRKQKKKKILIITGNPSKDRNPKTNTNQTIIQTSTEKQAESIDNTIPQKEQDKTVNNIILPEAQDKTIDNTILQKTQDETSNSNVSDIYDRLNTSPAASTTKSNTTIDKNFLDQLEAICRYIRDEDIPYKLNYDEPIGKVISSLDRYPSESYILSNACDELIATYVGSNDPTIAILLSFLSSQIEGYNPYSVYKTIAIDVANSKTSSDTNWEKEALKLKDTDYARSMIYWIGCTIENRFYENAYYQAALMAKKMWRYGMLMLICEYGMFYAPDLKNIYDQIKGMTRDEFIEEMKEGK